MSGRRLEPIRRPSPNREPGRGGERPRAVVLHTTAGRFESTVDWFARAESGVSAHYLVGLDGRLAQFVDERDTARHAGRISAPTAALAARADPEHGVNRFTIGIEFEDGGDPLGVARPAVQVEVGARLLAELAERWQIPLDRDHVLGHRELFAAKDCPGNLDLERLLRRARELAGRERAPEIACLLPARDAAEDLPGYLESAAALGARVLALDDGSGDATAELLAASPLVETLLRNPPRAGARGWDDGANRRALLRAAAELERPPEWVLFLDADERIDHDDAAALREFLATDALAGVAYGLELFRAWEGRVAPRPTNVFRLFAHDPAHELGPERLHFNPVPIGIPRSAWLRTTIRVRHLDSPQRLEARRAKYRDADPDSVYTGPTAALLEPPAEPLVDWRPRPAGLAVLSGRAGVGPAAPASGPALVCLLPARNCAPDLPGYLESAARVADAVLALDDGSTDSTAELLEASPLVVRLLRNPRRETYAGWDDAANRQALLEAAVEAGARWALFLDADERIDADDAAALRAFVAHQADPEAAYGFRVHRMVGDEGAYDRAELWVYRLFAPVAGQRLPDRALHLVPVPTSIPRDRWLKTTIRIQHLAGSTEERRRARVRKYEQADPERRWQRDYAGPILELGEPRPWRRRPPDLPVLADPNRSGVALDLEELDPDAPVLSAIVIARDDEATIERSVRAVLEQECPVPFEVIVVVSASPATAAVVRRAFGSRVRLVELAERALPGRARNAGLGLARGEYVSFPGSHVELPPGSLAHRFAAHERGWAMVTGSIVNGNPTPAGWASYFLDHSSALPGRPSGPLAGAPAHCSYVREFLLEAGGFPDLRAGEDTVVNEELWRRGHRAFRERRVQLVHRSPCTSPAALARHHFVRGRAFGRILRGDFRRGASLSRAARWRFLLRYPGRRLRDTEARVERWGGPLVAEYRRVRGLVALGVGAAALGAAVELLRPRRAGSAGSEQRRERHRLEPRVSQAGDDRGEGGDGDRALVQDHD